MQSSYNLVHDNNHRRIIQKSEVNKLIFFIEEFEFVHIHIYMDEIRDDLLHRQIFSLFFFFFFKGGT